MFQDTKSTKRQRVFFQLAFLVKIYKEDSDFKIHFNINGQIPHRCQGIVLESNMSARYLAISIKNICPYVKKKCKQILRVNQANSQKAPLHFIVCLQHEESRARKRLIHNAPKKWIKNLTRPETSMLR